MESERTFQRLLRVEGICGYSTTTSVSVGKGFKKMASYGVRALHVAVDGDGGGEEEEAEGG